MKSILTFSAILLITFQASYAQILSADQADFIASHFANLEADESYQNAKWDAVIEAIGSKRIVMVGEFNHGTKEVFIARNELIRELHKKHGFDLILFESGLGELEVINLKKQNLTPAQLTYGFFGPWRTKEFEALMTYVQQADIEISGFDVQRTGGIFSNYLTDKLGDNYFKAIEQEFVTVKKKLTNRRTVYDSILIPTVQLIKAYERIKVDLKVDDHFSIKTLENRIEYLNYMLQFTKDKDWNKRWEARDHAMANNLKWILSRQAPDRKVIVVAHNFHIAKYNEKENVMGEFLKADYGSEMYVIGAFAGKGVSTNNYGQTEQLSPPSEEGLDIKHIVAADQGRLTFLNLNQDLGAKGEWLHQPIIANDTFIDLSGSNQLILSKCFDGLLLFDAITPAEK